MKTRNPYRIQFDVINRFRGLWQKAGKQNIGKEYTHTCNNAVSTKIGQLDSREGQSKDTYYPEAIGNAGLLTTLRFLMSSSDVYIESTPSYLYRNITDLTSPSTWNCPPWGCIGTETCTAIWAALSTPAEEQKAGGVFPDCFTTSPWSCQDLWDRLETPLEYRQDNGYPDCFVTLPPSGLLKTCQDLWDITSDPTNPPDLSSYEVAGEADTSITDGNYTPCWKMTCQDMWDIFTDYSAYEVSANANLEMTETGGIGTLEDCWNTTLTCKQLYEANPEWDSYRKKKGTLETGCWDFKTDVNVTCQDFWDTYNTPNSYRKVGGTYPDCIDLPPFIPPKADSCRNFIWYLPTPEVETIDINLTEGYTIDDTRNLLTFELEASIYTGDIPISLKYKIEGDYPDRALIQVENDEWFYDYLNVDAPCRKRIFYTLPVVVDEGILGENSFSIRIQCYLNSGDFKGLHLKTYIVNVNVYSDLWNNLYTAYNQRRFMFGDSLLPDFSTYDFEDVPTQEAFIIGIHSWLNGCYVASNILFNVLFYQAKPFMKAGTEAGIKASAANVYFVDFSDMSDFAGIPDGFRRNPVSSPSYGSFQSGDEIGIHIFEDIDACFKVLKYVMQAPDQTASSYVRFAINGLGDRKFYITRYWFGQMDYSDVTYYSGMDNPSYYQYVDGTFEYFVGAYISPSGTDSYINSTQNVASGKWTQVVAATKNFTIGTPFDFYIGNDSLALVNESVDITTTWSPHYQSQEPYASLGTYYPIFVSKYDNAADVL